MKIKKFNILGPVLFKPTKHVDKRGFFAETFKQNTFEEVTGSKLLFVQDNISISLKKGTLRGLHFQMPEHAQGKLVSCQKGSILDVMVDIRKSSDTYGKYISIELNENCCDQLWVPPGFLHGYITTQDNCKVAYKFTNSYCSKSETTIIWNDKLLNINWGIDNPIVSEKDKNGKKFNSFESPFL